MEGKKDGEDLMGKKWKLLGLVMREEEIMVKVVERIEEY